MSTVPLRLSRRLVLAFAPHNLPRRTFRIFSTSTSHQEDLLSLKRQFQQALELCDKNRQSCSPQSQIQLQITDLEQEQGQPGFWDDSNSNRNKVVTSQLSSATRLLTTLQQWTTWEGDCKAAIDMLLEDLANPQLNEDERCMLLDELQTSSQQLLADNERFELELLLSGPYDRTDCILTITAGAGGTEANDWVSDLKRMYQRHATDQGYRCIVEDESPGDVVGLKSCELRIEGEHAYGWFKGEKGAHRLVRLSPFNANNKRQTTIGK